jgi:predicted nucleic acid-binding protein
MTERVFIDTSVVIRYLAEDDPPRAFAAAALIESDRVLVVSGVVLVETIHAMRTSFGHANPTLARAVIRFLTLENVELADADKAHIVAALEWGLESSARKIPDALVAATAEQAGCDWIATFDEAFTSPTVPSRLL